VESTRERPRSLQGHSVQTWQCFPSRDKRNRVLKEPDKSFQTLCRKSWKHFGINTIKSKQTQTVIKARLRSFERRSGNKSKKKSLPLFACCSRKWSQTTHRRGYAARPSDTFVSAPRRVNLSFDDESEFVICFVTLY